MTRSTRVPPGRSGRMWLRRRLATARRGRDQLDRKLRILVPELERRRLLAAARSHEWSEACEAAEAWQLRVTLLGGEDALRMATAATPVEVELRWAVTMGVAYPADAQVTPATGAAAPVANAAVAPAAAAFETALTAGARSAAADEAVRRVEAEVAVTRRRLRALDKRWLPWLEQELADLEVSLEQAEQEEGARLRLASAAVRGAGWRE